MAVLAAIASASDGFARCVIAWRSGARLGGLFLVGTAIGPAWILPAAAETLSQAETLSPAGKHAFSLQIGVGANGRAVFTWGVTDFFYDPMLGFNPTFNVGPIQARARSANGNLNPIQALTENLATSPQLGVAANGSAVFGWNESGSLKVRARSATGRLNPVQTVDVCCISSLHMGVDANGNAIFTWEDGGDILAQRRSGNGILEPLQFVEIEGNADSPQVAVNANGDAVFAWRHWDGTNWRVRGRARSASGVLSSSRTLSPSGEDAHPPRVAIGANGDAVFTWLIRLNGTNLRVQARARSATGILAVRQTLSAPGEDADAPHVAVDADGGAVFAWLRFDGANWRVQARARSAAGTLSPVQTFPGGGEDAAAPQVAVDAAGNAVFVWLLFDGSNWRVQSRDRSANGLLRTVQTLTGAGRDARDPRVVVDSAGHTVVFAWARFDGTSDCFPSAQLLRCLRVQTRVRTAQ